LEDLPVSIVNLADIHWVYGRRVIRVRKRIFVISKSQLMPQLHWNYS